MARQPRNDGAGKTLGLSLKAQEQSLPDLLEQLNSFRLQSPFVGPRPAS